jgi:hypothetical protein
MSDDFDSLRASKGIDEMSPEKAAQMEAAKAQFNHAISEVARFIGMALMNGKTDDEILTDLLQMEAGLRRDAASNDYRSELNPMKWALDHAIEKVRRRG